MANKDQKITVVAECTVSNGDVNETIRSFDKSWHRALELERPVMVVFNGFVRID